MANYNFRACGVVIWDGHVLLHRIKGDVFWSLPGGRIESGEWSGEAIQREFFEELRVQVKVGPLLWVIENHFTYRGKNLQEVGFYFSIFTDQLPHTLEFQGYEENLLFAWAALERLDEWDIRPNLLKDELHNLPKTPRLLQHRG